jgi:hypothetical protein
MNLSQNLHKLLLVGMGVGLGPFLQLLATPLLARIYSPEDFGYLALFTSTASVLIVISCLRYEGVIQIVRDKDIESSVLLSLLVGLFVMMIVSIAFFTGIPQLKFESLQNLGRDTGLLPIVAFAGGVTLVATNVSLRRGSYFHNAILRSGTIVFFVITAIFFPTIGLVNANAIAYIAVGCVSLFYLLRTIKAYSTGITRFLARQYIQFPLFLAPTSLLDAVTLTLPIFFISGSYGFDSTGYYSQIQRLIGAPIILAGIIAGQLFSKKTGELFRSRKSSKKLLWNTVLVLTLGAFITILGVVLFGKSLCIFILGEGWRVDTKFVLLAIAPIIVRSIVSPISTIFVTYNKIKYIVIWQCLYFVVSYSALFYAARTMQFDNFLIFYVITDSIMYLVYLLLANRIANFSG